MKIFFVIILVLLMVPDAVAAQDHHGGHGGHHDMPQKNVQTTMEKTARTAADRALVRVSNDMHAAMDVPLIGPPDADFLRAMIPHHQGAIDMVGVVRQYGDDPDLRVFADRIARVQGWEINLMNRILERMGEKKVTASPGAMQKSADTTAKKELLHIHHAMHGKMDVPLTGHADCDFVRAMIPHHQGAVDMAYWALAHGYHNDVRDLSRDIIQAQGSEISWMRGFAKRKACQ